ncbi:HAD-IC family P-type ATPase [Ammoniphilus sp. YIM 78166]|uniref:cation-translocating P-type ATPase n=1 Tax=Ammoniphilus sp. YIM 78166 TaxID=1644106 RepID=UPI00196A2272|nr:HAD-IC family P-type ATPase [Ammoniphilus sp. YIM 78166]
MDEKHEYAWHEMKSEEVSRRLETSTQGLTAERVDHLKKQYGKNGLPEKKPPTTLMIFLHQFFNPLIYILVVAGVLCILIGETADSVFIFVVILLNALLGTFQEWKAEKNAAALQNLLKGMARVKRNGQEFTVPAEDLVPGDLVFLESGSRVAADLRLVQASKLTIDEALLTGESIANTKGEELVARDTPLSERVNMAYAGTTVLSGRGWGYVTDTGLKTELGKIAVEVSGSTVSKPPLIIRMEKFSKQVSYIVLAACILLVAVAVSRGMPFTEVFFIAIALAVAVIPEGLPIAMTIVLSIATSRMLKRHVIVRKLTAVESLGSCTYIASDKTGTLTVNKQTVKMIKLPSGESFSVTGEGYDGEGRIVATRDESPSESERQMVERLVRAVVWCNEAQLTKKDDQWQADGDAVDVALLALGYKADLSSERVKEKGTFLSAIPYESENRYAAVFYQQGEKGYAAVKGAVETLLPYCETIATNHGIQAIDPAVVLEEAKRMAEGGYRVLAVADAVTDHPDSLVKDPKLPVLTLVGLVGLIDPLRPEAKEAVADCHRAGVKVSMVTGDHPATAYAIAKELGIVSTPYEVVTGEQLEKLGKPASPAFIEAVNRGRVFARVTPLQKLQIVDTLMNSGHFVAVTGDGANDAPAIRRASIGVAMGSGTDIAKDTASIIVTNDNFTAIRAGIEEGRVAYDNLRKVVYLLIATGLAEVLLFTLSMLFALPLPLVAAQLLWLNLVTNGIQDVALAFEGKEEGAMDRPPRDPSEGIIDKRMIQQVLVSGLTMGGISFAAWYGMLSAGWEESAARNLLLLLMVLSLNFHVLNCRSERKSVFSIPIKRNVFLIVGVFVALTLHLMSMQIPLMQQVLKAGPVSVTEFIVIVILASSVLLVTELFKLSQRMKGKSKSLESPQSKKMAS